TDARREDRRLDGTGAVDGRTAGIAVADVAGDGGDGARDGAAAVGVARQHHRGAADAAGRRLERAVLRVADDRDGGARPRVDEPQRVRHAHVADAQDGDVVVGVVGNDVGVTDAGVVRDLHARVALAGDDVRGRDDEVVGRE